MVVIAEKNLLPVKSPLSMKKNYDKKNDVKDFNKFIYTDKLENENTSEDKANNLKSKITTTADKNSSKINIKDNSKIIDINGKNNEITYILDEKTYLFVNKLIEELQDENFTSNLTNQNIKDLNLLIQKNIYLLLNDKGNLSREEVLQQIVDKLEQEFNITIDVKKILSLFDKIPKNQEISFNNKNITIINNNDNSSKSDKKEMESNVSNKTNIKISGNNFLNTQSTQTNTDTQENTSQDNGDKNLNNARNSDVQIKENNNKNDFIGKTQKTANQNETEVQDNINFINNIHDKRSNINVFGSNNEKLKPMEQSVFDQIVKNVEISKAENLSSVKIQLKPDFLGKIEINLVTADGNVTAHVITDSEKLKHQIESNLAILSNQLDTKGIKIDSFNVTVDKNMQFTPQYSGQNFKDESYKGNNQGNQELNMLKNHYELDNLSITNHVNLISDEHIDLKA